MMCTEKLETFLLIVIFVTKFSCMAKAKKKKYKYKEGVTNDLYKKKHTTHNNHVSKKEN